MKEEILKKITNIIFYVILLFIFVLHSCSEMNPNDGRFKVKSLEEGLETTKYQLIPLNGVGQMWVVGERGIYHVGDTLYMVGYACK